MSTETIVNSKEFDPKEFRDWVDKNIADFRADAEKMAQVHEAAKRVHDHGVSIKYPVAKVEDIVENFVQICSIHDVSIEQFEKDLMEMFDWPLPEVEQ